MISESSNRTIGNIQYRESLKKILEALVAASGGTFRVSSKGDRLTLADRKTRPFQGKSDEEIEQHLVSIIERAGFSLVRVIIPGEGLSRSFDTYVIHDDSSGRNYSVVFGMSHSSAEVMQFISLDTQVKQLTQNGTVPIEVFNGSGYELIDDVSSVGARGKKPDVVFTLNDDAKITVSLKNLPTGSPSEMQQWGGLKNFIGHDEILKFVDDVKKSRENPEIDKKRFYRRIKDEKIKDQVMWGTSGDRVDIILAGGIPMLVESEDRPGAYKIAFKDNTKKGYIAYRSTNDKLPDDFEPVLFARPASDRGFGGLAGYRFVAYPLKAAQSSGTLELPDTPKKEEIT
jgi:hypothetical protein